MQKKMKDNPYKKQKGRKNYKSMAISHIGINHNEWAVFSVYSHTMLKAPVLVRSLKLSSVGQHQYLDGWPPGNMLCCRLTFYCHAILRTVQWDILFDWLWQCLTAVLICWMNYIFFPIKSQCSGLLWAGGEGWDMENKTIGLVIFKMCPTAQHIPRRSPIQVLTLPNVA